ncbi:MAG: 5-formyltetrahydrofolate cyclo-ligase [Candidatus Competibacteraceae bacterium]|nr:5-formyltetrahydrofolate cyclo-ligase [Candidatus Competibacteraceae bacterium]
MTDRDGLRQRLRSARRNLPLIERQEAALAVARRVLDWPPFGAAARIAAYWAREGELDPKPLLEAAWAEGKDVYLPVVIDAPSRSLRFAPYRPGCPLRRNRFAIPEPDVPESRWLAPEALDLVLLPLVAFDAAGVRLGMGGGFYDRSFAFLRHGDDQCRRPWLLGLGYEFQQSPEPLPLEPWDVPLHAVATDQHLRVFGQARHRIE